MRTGTPQPNLQSTEAPLSIGFWTMLIATGVLAGFTGGLLMRLLYATEHLAFSYSVGSFLEGVRHTSATQRVAVSLAAGVFAGIAGLLTSRLKGNTDLSRAVWISSGYLPVLKSSIKALYSIVAVGLGATVGRENSLKQVGGVIANVTASWKGLSDEERRLLVACGGGAGMAAAYNVPLGGALFALEILLGSFSIRAALPAFAASMLATWTSWILLPDQATYTISAASASTSIILWAVAAGPLCGLLAVPFIRLLGWAKSSQPKAWQALVFPILSLGAVGLVAIRFPEMLGNGKDVVEVAFLNESTTFVLVVLLILRPLATAAVLRSGVPGGLFTPTMSLGAVVGLLLGRGWSYFLPNTIAAGQLPTCALVGSAAVLAAATQGPISSVIFVLELTRSGSATIVPILIAVVAATFVTRLFEDRSIYSIGVVETERSQ